VNSNEQNSSKITLNVLNETAGWPPVRHHVERLGSPNVETEQKGDA
jgi:hypothetical protein